MINFNVPPFVDSELECIRDVLHSNWISGDGKYTKRCSDWIKSKFKANYVLLTTSGTTALEMAMLLCDLRPGDEVILPSYTFSSTATAPVSVGAKLVFVDIRPDTMNIDENLIESAITDKTKAIIVMHYGGVACEMDTIIGVARRYNLKVIEDAAQGFGSSYKGRFLGTIGDFGCYSFHETKNFSMGEGGAIVINDDSLIENAEIMREKGTDRSKFYRGMVDKYTWIDKGSSYLPSELNAAYLWAQLEIADDIQTDRMYTWNKYRRAFDIEELGIELQTIPSGTRHNAHMFYIKLKNLDERQRYIEYMKKRNINCAFHYVPLHSSPGGQKYGRFHGRDRFTTIESERLVRLPLYYLLSSDSVCQIIESSTDFLKRCAM